MTESGGSWALELKVAREAARRAREITLPSFRAGLTVDRKADRTPVTRADREAEESLTRTVLDAFPGDSVLGEEATAASGAGAGADPGQRGRRWIFDPIDGTRSFVRGIPFWSTLIALEVDGIRVVGVVDLPALDRTYHGARGHGAWCGTRRLEVSTRSSMDESTLVLGEMPLLAREGHGEAMLGLMQRFELVRCYGDAYGATFVLDGAAEVWVETGVKSWDLAPLEVLVEEAGGRFTSLTGASGCHGGSAVLSHGPFHEAVLERLGARQ